MTGCWSLMGADFCHPWQHGGLDPERLGPTAWLRSSHRAEPALKDAGESRHQGGLGQGLEPDLRASSPAPSSPLWVVLVLGTRENR